MHAHEYFCFFIYIGEKEMGGFGWYLDKNHKHHHHSMSVTYFSVGVTSLFFVNYFSSISVFLAILSFLLGSLSFVYSVYHIKEQIKKDRLQTENKIKNPEK
jgi:hypothetical protein